MGREFTENIFGKYKKYWSEELGQEVYQEVTSLPGAATPLAAAVWLVTSSGTFLT